MSDAALEGSYVAALWEHPTLCVALFGVQYLTEEGRRLYEESGIGDEIDPSLQTAEGLLHGRSMMTEQGPVVMLYWRSYADLDRYARLLPHGRWWKWLVNHTSQGIGFYHEIYEVKAAEAIFEPGAKPVGPAAFSSLLPAIGGEGRSKERMRRFREAALAAE
jgi:hypothetical protein